MTSWTDSYGRWHDKPTDGKEPSSNNGYVYSAYAKNLSISVDIQSISECFHSSVQNINHVEFNRHPNIWQTDRTPPPSRDEILGLISLDVLEVKYLAENHWCYGLKGETLGDLNWFKVILELLKLSDEHRNAVWQGNYPNASQVAFRLGFHDIFYVKHMANMPTTDAEEMIWSYYVDDMIKSDDWSARNICIMQMEDIGLDAAKLVKSKSYNNYFRPNHPFLNLV